GDREVGHAVAEVVADLVTGHGDRERVRFAVPAGGGVDVGRGAAADRGEQELDGGEGGVRAVAGGGAEVDGPAPGAGRGETAGRGAADDDGPLGVLAHAADGNRPAPRRRGPRRRAPDVRPWAHRRTTRPSRTIVEPCGVEQT